MVFSNWRMYDALLAGKEEETQNEKYIFVELFYQHRLV